MYYKISCAHVFVLFIDTFISDVDPKKKDSLDVNPDKEVIFCDRLPMVH